MRAGAAAIVVAVIAAAAPGRGHADGDEAAAQAHLDRGVIAFRAGDYARAHAELVVARDLAPDRPNPYRWLALTGVQLGDCARALGDIAEFLARVASTDPRVAEMERLRALCARTGGLAVTSEPAGVALRIDGSAVGATPYRSLSMRAGEHTLRAEQPGYRPVTRAVVVPAAGELTVHLRLAPRRGPVTRRWWFWAATIGAAAAVTTALVVVATDGEPAVFPPIQCDPTGCRPGAP